MAIPTHQDAMLPVLQQLASGEPQNRRALAEVMADHFKLTADEREAMLPSEKATVIRSRTGWALSYLKQAGLCSAPRRGWYQITEEGRKVLAERPFRLDNRFLLQFEGFRAFRARSRRRTGTVEQDPQAVIGESSDAEEEGAPDEALEDAYGRLRASVESDLLDTIKAASPSFFEQVVIDLLVRMGYGGSREEAARKVGRSGDGGIDGVIDEDRLGLDAIYVQAKRWEGSVGRPEIQKFAGALQGQRAKKGIFITTSFFTREAEDYTQRIESRIVLIDGRRLAALMFESDVGVSPRGVYTVKAIDGDYFEES